MRELIRGAATYRSRAAVVRLVAAAVLAVAASLCVGPVVGQTRSADGREQVGEHMESVYIRGDSVLHRATRLADSLRAEGYYFAELDTASVGDSPLAVVTPGPRVRLAELRVIGVDEAAARSYEAALRSAHAEFFDPILLEEDIDRLLRQLEREGRPLARVEVESIRPAGDRPEDLVAVVAVDPGPVVPLKRIEITGGRRTSSRLVGRLAELEVGVPLVRFEPDRIRARLEEAGLFDVVGTPELYIEADTSAVVRIPITEGDPGTFDLVLGYLPPGGSRDEGQVVGNGHLALRNLFGGGRALSFRLNRMPGQVSSVDFSAADPYVAGLPLGARLGFHGFEQDSTYGKRSYRGELSYRVAGGVEVFGGFSREATGPGQAGLRLGDGGRQVVPHARAWFGGLGARMSTVDRPVNPSRGLFVEMNLDTGRKERTERRIVDGDTTRASFETEQRRLEASGRIFAPVVARQVFVFGMDARLLLSEEYDRSDLFRFGGASSLRGYDEDRFLGRVAGRALVEYRFLIDLQSYAYGFIDLGYVDRPATPDLAADRGFHPGYGVGIQFRSAVGLVNVSAALNPESGPTEARIHAGLTFGL